MANLTQSRIFFGHFLDFRHNIGDMSYGIRYPPAPYFGHGQSKNDGPIAKRDSAWAEGSREVGRFSQKTMVSLNSKPQPTTNSRAYISNMSFWCRKRGGM